MAIDDNTSYELTGYQVKDLAQKVRAKADSASLASVATSGLYSDLTGTPTIPTVNNGTLTIQQNGTTVGTFTANQSTNETVNLIGGIYADDPTSSANPDGWVASSDIDWSTFTDGSTYFTIGSLLIQFGLKNFGNVSYSNAYWGSTNRSQNLLHVDFPKAFSGTPYYVSINPIGAQQIAAVWNTSTSEDSATRSRDFNIIVPSHQTGTLETKVYWLAIGPA